MIRSFWKQAERVFIAIISWQSVVSASDEPSVQRVWLMQKVIQNRNALESLRSLVELFQCLTHCTDSSSLALTTNCQLMIAMKTRSACFQKEPINYLLSRNYYPFTLSGRVEKINNRNIFHFDLKLFSP